MENKKLSIAVIMSLYSLNNIQVQNLSGITTDAVNDANMNRPIYREDAEKICTCLSKLTGKHGTLTIPILTYWKTAFFCGLFVLAYPRMTAQQMNIPLYTQQA